VYPANTTRKHIVPGIFWRGPRTLTLVLQPAALCIGGVGQITVPLAPIDLVTSKTSPGSEADVARRGAEWDAGAAISGPT